MTKCTVTVNQNHELVHPSSESFATANDLVTVNNLYNLLPENTVKSLKLTGYDEENRAEYQVKLSVSITKIGEGDNMELIPQINLSIVDEED